ncbi:TIGR00297 family protein [Methanothrix sp.]|uniref:TIGR00297 family protein n=1 Tax=Methanothrix sp. TaxID=90426 RepID=UPI003C709435
MQKEDALRLAMGALAFLLPVTGVFTAVLLAIIYIIHRPARMLSASLMLLLLLREALTYTHLDLPMYVVAISFIPPTVAYTVSKRFQQLAGSFIYIMATVAIGYPAAYLSAPYLLQEKILFMTILGGLSGAFLQHVSREMDFTVPFGACMVMWLFSFEYPLPELSNILMIYIFAVLLGVGAYWAKAADVDAVLSEVIICILVVLFAGLKWFLLLLCFYLMGGAFTRYGYSYKQSMGIAQEKCGVRGYKNVYSNSLVPLVAALCYGVYGNEIFFYAFLGAVATANGDTLASEIGETSRSRPRMITTLKPVDPGVDGGVTPLGEMASLAGGAAIGLVAVATGMTGVDGFLIAITSGLLGSNFDSLMGAIFQRRGVLTNNGVNLVATLFGGIVGALMGVLI